MGPTSAPTWPRRGRARAPRPSTPGTTGPRPCGPRTRRTRPTRTTCRRTRIWRPSTARSPRRSATASGFRPRAGPRSASR
ncbi:MAG: hypothetical protein F4X78_12520 [Gammaproteobacteria bacterium]|nr:hypothetical protein [Gammaproteobacteria bacterium]